ncbi:MAG: ABC transporter permease [Candidatus Hodarchaeota archaeon]
MSSDSEFLAEEKLEEFEKEKQKRRRVGRLMIFFRRFRRHKVGMLGLAIIIFAALVGLLAPYIAGQGKLVPYDPQSINLNARYLPPLSYEIEMDDLASYKIRGMEKTVAAIYFDQQIYFSQGQGDFSISPYYEQLSRIDSITSLETGEELWNTSIGQYNLNTNIISLTDDSFNGTALVDYRIGGKLAIHIIPNYDTIAAIKLQMKVDTEFQAAKWGGQESYVYLYLYEEDGNINSTDDAIGSSRVPAYSIFTGGLGIRAALVQFNFGVSGIKVQKGNLYHVVLDTHVLEIKSQGVYQRMFIESTGTALDPQRLNSTNWNAITGWNKVIPTPNPGSFFPSSEGWLPLIHVFYLTNNFHVFGTDSLGRDILSATIWGATASLSVAFIAQAVGITIGLTVGTIAGYYGGFWDNLLMRITDIILSIPTLFLLLIAVAVWETITLPFMAVTIGLLGWSGTARLVRAQFLSLREMEYAEAALALGVPDRTIIFKHLLPNALAPVIVNETLGTAAVILIEAGLSFLGFGDPLAVSWGTAIQWGMTENSLRFAPWVATIPGLAIFVVVLAFNLMGDALRDAIDPRLKS